MKHAQCKSIGMLSTLCAFPAACLAGDCTPDWSTSIGNPGLNAYVSKYVAWDDGTGEALYAAGQFTTAGGNSAPRIAKWDGSSWSGLGGGPADNWANTIDTYQGDLYLGGSFGSVTGVPNSRGLVKWDGENFEALDTGWDNFMQNVWALEEYNGELYVGGTFTEVGGVSVNNIARWDGESWADVGGGVTEGIATIAIDMLTWDDGGGEDLYVVGRFDFAGGVETPLVARWDGEAWSKVGSTLDGTQALNLAVWDDGTGEALYLCGGQTTPEGASGSNVHKLVDGEWIPLPDTIGEPGTLVWDLQPYDDGSGEALYAIGTFSGNGPDISRFAKWDGNEWTEVGGGLDDNGFTIFPWNDPDQPGATALYLGGSFATAGGNTANAAAIWNGCAEPPTECPEDLDGSGTVDSADLNIILGEFGCLVDCVGDIDGNGTTDSADLNAVLGAFGTDCP